MCVLGFGRGSDFIGLSSFNARPESFVKFPPRLSDPGRDRKLLSSIRNERAIGFEYLDPRGAVNVCHLQGPIVAELTALWGEANGVTRAGRQGQLDSRPAGERSGGQFCSYLNCHTFASNGQRGELYG